MTRLEVAGGEGRREGEWAQTTGREITLEMTINSSAINTSSTTLPLPIFWLLIMASPFSQCQRWKSESLCLRPRPESYSSCRCHLYTASTLLLLLEGPAWTPCQACLWFRNPGLPSPGLLPYSLTSPLCWARCCQVLPLCRQTEHETNIGWNETPQVSTSRKCKALTLLVCLVSFLPVFFFFLIYLFILTVMGLCWFVGFFPSCREQGLLL